MQNRKSAEITITYTADGKPIGSLFNSLWHFRDFILILCWRDIKVRYKQTILGMAWVVIVPFVSMIIFSLIFGGLAKMPSDGMPYPIFVFSGLLIWQLFNKAFTDISQCLTNNLALIKKVYFPKIALPVASALPGLVDFACGFLVLLVLMVYYDFGPSIEILLIPIIAIFALLSALSVGLWLAALNATYRDVRYLLPFVSQLWFYMTPVVYPISVVPEPWNGLLYLNPMTLVIVATRWSVLGADTPPISGILISLSIVSILTAGGIIFFRNFEKNYADRL